MATIRLVPSTYYIDSNYLSVSNASNMYNNTDNTTYATVNNTRTGTTTYYIYIRGFNFDAIPSGAIINSFTIKLKASQTGGTTNSSYSPKLCNGENQITSTCSQLTTSVNTYTFTDITATWEQIKNYGSDFGIRINCRRNNRNTSASFYIYGAEIEVDYTIPIYHQITSVSNTDLVQSISPEGTTTIQEGDNYTLDIYTDNINDIIVEDNGTDVTSQLIQKEIPSGGTLSTVLGQYTLVSGSFNGSGATYFSGIVGNGVDASQTTSDYYSGRSGTIAVFTYKLLFDNIPSNATITRLYCQVNGHAESTSNSNEYMCVQLRCGNTELCDEINFKSIGTSNTTQTLEAETIPSVSELEDLVLYCRLGYYGGAINGATCYIEYTVPSATVQYYWQYTLNNVNDDHTIYVMEAVVIPPDEDPEKTYYSLTISSINASTNPGKGTTRVESLTNNTITITPSDPQLTLALDNGVDVTSQLVAHGGTIPSPTVATAPGASYGFNLNSSTGYYESTNDGINQSASVARVTFNLPVRCLVTIQYINYAEEGYDYGMFGNIDTSVAVDGLTANSGSSSPSDSISNYKLSMASNSTSAQTITYEIESGEHFIDIKYGKDDATDDGYDSLQWKITSIEPLETNNYYTYDLTNISQDHSLIFIFGDVTYYFVNLTKNGTCTLYPSGQMVQLPGDSYRLTIIPENNNDTVTLTDNNIDKTSQLERKEVTTTKSGQTITVVNYIYRLSDIQATHSLAVSSASQGLSSSIYLNDQWNEGTLNRKQDDRWGTLTYTRIWVHNGTTWVEDAQRTIITNGIIPGGVIDNDGE